MEIIEEHADEDAYVIFGTTTDSSIDIDEVTITIIATGFEDPSTIAPPTSTPSPDKNHKPKEQRDTKPRTSVMPPKRTGFRRAVGSEIVNDDDILEFPTFLRNQMD